MKKIIIFISVVYAISCLLCEGQRSPSNPGICHSLQTDLDDSYCCYYEGLNTATNTNEKECWEYEKVKIDNNGYKDVISAIEDGTDRHVTQKHENVKLDCFASYIKNFLFIGLLLLF